MWERIALVTIQPAWFLLIIIIVMALNEGTMHFKGIFSFHL